MKFEEIFDRALKIHRVRDRAYSGHEQFSSMPFGMLQSLMFLNTKSKRVENLMKEAMKHSWQFEKMPADLRRQLADSLMDTLNYAAISLYLGIRDGYIKEEDFL